MAEAQGDPGDQGAHERAQVERRGLSGSLGNLSESSGQECSEVTHRYGGMMTEESWEEF